MPVYYRRNYRPTIVNRLSLKDYISNTVDYQDYKHEFDNGDEQQPGMVYVNHNYDFNSVLDYYDERAEFDYVGIVDQESSRRKMSKGQVNDEFKLRGRRPKVLPKKRETGVPSFKGAVCRTSKDKPMLLDIASKLNLDLKRIRTRTDICQIINDKLYDLEKYSTSKNKNKLTYLIVPANHPTIPFPLNLEDRCKRIINEIKRETRSSIMPVINVIPIKQGKFNDIDYVKYQIVYDNNMDRYSDILKLYNAHKKNNEWIINVD